MEQIDRINKIIQQFLDKNGDYNFLKPITHIDRCYGVCRKFGFNPTDGKFESYDTPSQFKDESERIKFIKKLNQDITKYNETIDIIQHPEIDSFPYYSFLVIRDGYEYVDKQLYVEIVDEELYKLKEDEDFIPRFNRTIYGYIISKKESAQAEDRWDEENIWYTPYRNFGDWFDKHPKYGDVDPYFTIGTQVEKHSSTEESGISPNSKWEQITIWIEPTLDSDIPNIRIKTPDYDKCHHPGQYGFTTKNHPNKTTKVFETLRKFAILKGRITSEVNNPVTIKQVSMLRTHLSELFGITEPSISNYSKLNGWKCNFSISDKRHEEGGYDDIIHQLNLKNARNQDALSHTNNKEVEPFITDTG